MIRLLLPLVLALAGLGAGIGAALVLRPEPAPAVASDLTGSDPASCTEAAPSHAPSHEEPLVVTLNKPSEYVELGDQFVVPVVENGAVRALVVLSLSVEIAPGFDAEILAHRPKLRDLFLRDLLDHANHGGFEGTFTANGTMDRLRSALRETGQRAMGKDLRDVLILDINRQELV